jgi:hypothetical protein
MEAATVSREYHDNNVFAHDVKNAIKHISEVVSGRKGYYCMGCQREMQAKKGDKKSHHFAHDPKDVDTKGKCTYSDETYRHKLAKEVLQVIKQMKVPALYKYPPLGEEGTPVKLRDSRTIYAHSVEIELPFFEAEDGQVKWGRKSEFSESSNRYLLIQPDVAFFDADDKPVLLIEIVATHKVDTDKLSKIRRLGIDVVQITVPKDSPAEIQGAFYKTNRTKWLYSYEQETTAYVRIPQGNPEGIPPLDEFQRKLLKAAESFECRASQITGLLRAIGKSMGSEQYRIADQSVRDEIRRVERNTEGASAEVRVLQEKYRAAVADQFKLEEESVATATSGVEDLLTWKQDIIEKEKNLQVSKKRIDQDASQRLISLQETWQNLEQVEAHLKSEKQQLQRRQLEWDSLLMKSKKQLQALQEENKKQLTDLGQEEKVYLTTIASLRSKSKANLNQIQQECDSKLQQVEMSCWQSLNETEESLLKQLRVKVLKEHPVSVEELGKLLMQGDFSTLSKKKSLVSAECEKLKNYLIREITKTGYSLEDFLAKV